MRRYVTAKDSAGFDWGPYPGTNKVVWILMFPFAIAVWTVGDGFCLVLGHKPEKVGPTELFCERCGAHIVDTRKEA